MTRKRYASYKYEDPDDLYVYPDSGVLRNKFNIKSAQELQAKEYRIVTNKLLDLFENPIHVYSLGDIQKIHQFLFEEIYHWAGEFRQVNISKDGNPFMAMQAFDTGTEYMNKLITDYHQQANDKSSIIKYLAEILDNLNYMHPFREGNGRTQREVIRVLALAKGYILEVNLNLDDDIYHLYMDGIVNGDTSLLEELFTKIMETNE
ncbi:Fic/DOC family protein [Oceanobacillus indicireducens]|uniref:protein adenylyltransferase n=1 Tax=Oceanobacillus indicireducens TaxID=1004261 RepID=A0A917XWU8_9BACI|nr:Fic family protein [Oceanobacillus indicireducens]GGN57284.1 cell division protein Fic [Oceanobacillus indicireducens]